MFDTKNFINTKLSPRTEEIKVKELQSWFGEDEPIWTVTGLGHKQIAIAEERSSTDHMEALVKAVAGNTTEQADAIRKIMGVDNGAPKDTKKRIELLVMGSVNPKIEQEVAVKIAINFPTVLIQLTNAILKLTGLGSDSKVKLKPSGKD